MHKKMELPNVTKYYDDVEETLNHAVWVVPVAVIIVLCCIYQCVIAPLKRLADVIYWTVCCIVSSICFIPKLCMKQCNKNYDV